MFILGLVIYERRQHYFFNDHRIDAVKLALVKNWYWQYASFMIQGLGMAATNLFGYHVEQEDKNEFTRVQTNCRTELNESTYTLPNADAERMAICIKTHTIVSKILPKY